MSEEQKKSEETLEDEEDSGINLFDYLIVLAKRKKLILAITLSVAVIATASSLLVKNTYWARTTILLPQTGGGGPRWARILNEFSGGGMIQDSGITDPFLFEQLLYSGQVLNKIIDKFDLAKDYADAESTKDLQETLSSSMTTEFILPKGAKKGIGLPTSRLIMISVKDKDPAKAADMANAFVEALQDFIKDIAFTSASQKRLFFEKQLKQTKEDLIKSEEAMKEFQEKTGVFKVEQQAGAVFEGIAKLRAEIAAKEVELSVMKSYSTSNNPDFQRVIETIKGLKAELAKLEQKGGNGPDTLITTGRMASVGTDYIRKMRDLKYNEALYEIMMKQYEMARIEEAGDPTLIQVLEKAYPSEERAGPQRKKRIAKATGSAFFLSVFLVLFLEFLKKQEALRPETYEKIQRLKESLSFKTKAR